MITDPQDLKWSFARRMVFIHGLFLKGYSRLEKVYTNIPRICVFLKHGSLKICELKYKMEMFQGLKSVLQNLQKITWSLHLIFLGRERCLCRKEGLGTVATDVPDPFLLICLCLWNYQKCLILSMNSDLFESDLTFCHLILCSESVT